MDEISRTTDEHGYRLYTDGDVEVPSVTTILDLLEEDTTGLERWKAANDGEGDSPYWQHLFWFSGKRGTLCHYQALVAFEFLLEDDDQLWGREESEAMQDVMDVPDDAFTDMEDGEDVPTDNEEVLYSVLKNKGVVSSRKQFDAILADSTSLLQIVEDDCDYFTRTFDDVRDVLGIDDEKVIAVEQYLLNDAVGYGGQTDLVYEDPAGNIVVADLKTSSAARQKHRLQAIAYGKAIEYHGIVDEVDRVEVIRIQPDDKEWEVLASEVPEHLDSEPRYTSDDWLRDPWGDWSYESIDDMWEKFTELTEKAND